MDMIVNWKPAPGSLTRPVYRSLADQLSGAIEVGSIPLGTRLPPHRELAYELSVSVQTVSRAYDELARRGLVSGHVGRGTYVRSIPSEQAWPFPRELSDSDVIDCLRSEPVTGPVEEQAFREAVTRLADRLPSRALLSFLDNVPLADSVEPALSLLKRCGIVAQPECLHVTNGNTSALFMALMTCVRPGDLVVSTVLSHYTLRRLSSYLGFRLEGLEMDSEGLVPAAFENACRADRVRAVYLAPDGVGPTASVMSQQRCVELAEIATRHDVLVIENDGWGPLQPKPKQSIVNLIPERTLYFTGFSWCLMPSPRVEYLVVPKHLGDAFAGRQEVVEFRPNPLSLYMATDWILDGTARKLFNRQRQAIAKRVDMAKDRLGDYGLQSSRIGPHVWLPLKDERIEAAFVRNARAENVAVAKSSDFLVSDSPAPRGVRISLGATSLPNLKQALKTLSHIAETV